MFLEVIENRRDGDDFTESGDGLVEVRDDRRETIGLVLGLVLLLRVLKCKTAFITEDNGLEPRLCVFTLSSTSVL